MRLQKLILIARKVRKLPKILTKIRYYKMAKEQHREQLKMDDAQKKLIDKFMEEYGYAQSESLPETLYHYTSNESFLKISKSNSLWMTHAQFMNDSAEFTHGMSKFKKGINELEKNNLDKNWLQSIRKFFDREMTPSAEPYIFSMTESPDQLSQWRGYGDSCRGLSFGLKTSDIPSFNSRLTLMKVVYDAEKQNKVVQATIDGFIKLIKYMDKNTLDDGVKWGPLLARGYFIVAYLQSVRFKHSSWQEENEWRMVYITNEKESGIFTRTRGSALIKYYELSIPNLTQSLDQIIIGPLAEKLTQTMALEFIRNSNHSHFVIINSKISMK